MIAHRLALPLLLISCVAAALTPAFALGITERVSVSTSEEQANALSRFPAISADGRCVAFESAASNLVADDANSVYDVFVRNRLAGTTERVSVSSAEVEGNGASYWPSISADGRYVAFHSSASNLVGDDTNSVYDVFVRDRLAGTTERVSVSSAGGEGNLDSAYLSISADGRYVAFWSAAGNLVENDANGYADIFVHDRDSGSTIRVSISSAGVEANAQSAAPAISADGLYVAFESSATNLVGSDTNGMWDVFVHDRVAGTTERISISSAEIEGNYGSGWASVSADGRYVAFWSVASNLVPGDTNATSDVFVRDRDAGTVERVSVSSAEAQGNAGSGRSSINADGSYVAFSSDASDLVVGDGNGRSDIFVRDRQHGETERVSLTYAGAQANGHSYYPSMSADGTYVAFGSDATNLVAGDTNAAGDIFGRGPAPVPQVLLEVHPNERAPGVATSQYLGKSPWTQPTNAPAANYWWKTYEFAAHGPLWIQVCAQDWSSTQKGYAANDRTKLVVNGLVPTDYDLIQTGTPGSWQWLGKNETGKRVTLRFLAPTTPGKQSLWIGAAESPAVWWLKVTDLEPDLIGPIE